MQVMHRIEGVRSMKLPWQGTLSTALYNELGIFRKPVFSLLARDPAARPSTNDF